MVKFLLGMSKGAMDWLRGEAERLGISVSELLRRIVDEKRDNNKRGN